MLQKITRKKTARSHGEFAIVASKYNARYVDALVRAAQAVLTKAGTKPKVVRVPGAFEIPVVASLLARSSVPKFAAIICLGVIFQGETAHAQHIAEAVSHGLTRIQIETGVPVIHGVLLFENEEQARARCLSRDHNRGTEAAQTALEMAAIVADLIKVQGVSRAADPARGKAKTKLA
ncbi:MAG: 6,7-dimethyl-8-ribityllumazine synthase [Verrucomicrobia bacterium]|nr:6,7-dimethyl-8-ribityllumazine synthase [Verrucomicrobiota bacterium]